MSGDSPEDADQERPKPPKAPAGLHAPGRALWRRLVADYELDARELIVLEAAARQADVLEDLRNLLERQGLTVVGSTGAPRLSPVPAELRQGRLALSKLLDALALPVEDDEGAVGLTAASRRAQKAANARHGRERTRRERSGLPVSDITERRRRLTADGST